MPMRKRGTWQPAIWKTEPQSRGEISVVMTNRNPGVPQEESGVEWMVDRRFCRGNED